MEIDRYDRQILQVLQDDGRISNQALADKVGERCLRLGMTAGTQDEGLDVARVRRTV